MADFVLPLGQNRILLEASFVDASGSVVKPDNDPVWTASSPLVSLNPSANGRSCVVKRVAPRNRSGELTVTVSSVTSDGETLTDSTTIKLHGNGPVSVSLSGGATSAEP